LLDINKGFSPHDIFLLLVFIVRLSITTQNPTMKTTLSFLLITLLTLYTGTAFAEGDKFVIAIDEARINISSSLDGSEAYMEIINYTQDKPVTLTRVSSEMAGNVRLHHANKPVLVNGEATDHALTIKPASSEALSDKGYYIHLEELSAPITKGQRIPLLLTFEHGDSYLVDAVAVEPGTHLHGDESDGFTAHSDH
jgi:copper(I)-binding protein